MSSQNKPLKTPVKAGDFHALGHESLKRQDFAAARDYLEQSIALTPTTRAHHDLGVVFYQQEEAARAIEHFRAAVALDPAWHQSYANLYRIMQHTGNVDESLRYCALAIKHGPEVEGYKEDFVRIAQGVTDINFDVLLKDAVTAFLRDYDYNHQEILPLWFALLKKDPGLQNFRKILFVANEKEFREMLTHLPEREFFVDPFLIYGLRRLRIPQMAFENLIKNLRHVFLIEDINFSFMAAIAEYCFSTEYVMSVTDEKQSKINAIKAQLESDELPTNSAHLLCVLGCYEPLYTLKNAAVIAKTFKNDKDIGPLITLQISEPLQERAIRSDIPSFSSPEDSVSISVREQYEEFPYPRWKTLSKMYANELYAAREKGEAHSVLNAGCGTGCAPLTYAARFPNVDMVAIDLSLSSLSYAKREAEKRGIKNVQFMHGDILDVEKIGRTFDLVHSTGVIHHMRDPMQGWRALVKVLKPGGLMRMALYSDIARRDVVTAQNAIIARGYTSDAEGIRKFRNDVRNVLPPDVANDLQYVPDFYSLSECRDLLFHVQEHRFDIPMLKKSLQELGLEFICFSLPRAFMDRFGAVAADMRDLDRWAEFEEKNPKTFAAMYQFWCRKK